MLVLVVVVGGGDLSFGKRCRYNKGYQLTSCYPLVYNGECGYYFSSFTFTLKPIL